MKNDQNGGVAMKLTSEELQTLCMKSRADRLRAVFQSAGHTQPNGKVSPTQVARFINKQVPIARGEQEISKQRVAEWLTGSEPAFDVFSRIARAYGYSVTWMNSGKGNPALPIHPTFEEQELIKLFRALRGDLRPEVTREAAKLLRISDPHSPLLDPHVNLSEH